VSAVLEAAAGLGLPLVTSLPVAAPAAMLAGARRRPLARWLLGAWAADGFLWALGSAPFDVGSLSAGAVISMLVAGVLREATGWPE
jgi:hypothetical protein